MNLDVRIISLFLTVVLLASPCRANGTIKVTCDVPAYVELKGEKLGWTPLQLQDLHRGTYELTITALGTGETKLYKVSIPPRKSVIRNVTAKFGGGAATPVPTAPPAPQKAEAPPLYPDVVSDKPAPTKSKRKRAARVKLDSVAPAVHAAAPVRAVTPAPRGDETDAYRFHAAAAPVTEAPQKLPSVAERVAALRASHGLPARPTSVFTRPLGAPTTTPYAAIAKAAPAAPRTVEAPPPPTKSASWLDQACDRWHDKYVQRNVIAGGVAVVGAAAGVGIVGGLGLGGVIMNEIIHRDEHGHSY